MTTLFEEYRIFSIKLVDLCLFEFAVYLGLLLLKKSFFLCIFLDSRGFPSEDETSSFRTSQSLHQCNAR